MALRAVPDHPKFAEFKALLGVPKYAALGCLEAIWHFTGRFTPQGNIGKYSDAAIESWVEWKGKPGLLIAALKQAGWIESHSRYRLLVHDWAEHADNATKMSLKRKKLSFIEPDTDTVSGITVKCGDTVATELRLPEPEPEPVPEPENISSASDDAGNTHPSPEVEKRKAAPPLKRELLEQQKAWFPLFWDRYWRKRDKKPAWDQFKRHVTTEEVFQGLMRAIERDTPMMLKRIAEKGDQSCIKYPERYIKSQPWLDGDDTAEIQEAPRRVEKVAASFRNRSLEQFQQDQKPPMPDAVTPEFLQDLKDQAENSPIALIRELAVKRLAEIQNPEVPKWKN